MKRGVSVNLLKLRVICEDCKAVMPIGGTVRLDGVVCAVLGFVLKKSGSLHLVAAEYSEGYIKEAEELEKSIKNGEIAADTNRFEQLDGCQLPRYSILESVTSVCTGGVKYDVEGLSIGFIRQNAQNRLAMLCSFLNAGWDPGEIGEVDIKNICLTTIKLKGVYSALPGYGDGTVRIFMGPCERREAVGMPMDLPVGEGLFVPLRFCDGAGDAHSIVINRVYLCDVRSELKKQGKGDAQWQTQTADNDAIRIAIDNLCPDNMVMPVVEYTCDEDIELGLFDRGWLDAVATANEGGAVGIIFGCYQNGGRECLVRTPCRPDTERLSLELVWISRTVNETTLVFNP